MAYQCIHIYVNLTLDSVFFFLKGEAMWVQDYSMHIYSASNTAKRYLEHTEPLVIIQNHTWRRSTHMHPGSFWLVVLGHRYESNWGMLVFRASGRLAAICSNRANREFFSTGSACGRSDTNAITWPSSGSGHTSYKLVRMRLSG